MKKKKVMGIGSISGLVPLYLCVGAAPTR